MVHHNLSVGSSSSPSVYGEVMISVSVRNFRKWALQLNFERKYGRLIWIGPALFFTMRIINDALSTSKETGRPIDVELKESTNLCMLKNVEFLDVSREIIAMDERLNNSIVRIRAVENNLKTTWLSFSYGKHYRSILISRLLHCFTYFR